MKIIVTSLTERLQKKNECLEAIILCQSADVKVIFLRERIQVHSFLDVLHDS